MMEPKAATEATDRLAVDACVRGAFCNVLSCFTPDYASAVPTPLNDESVASKLPCSGRKSLIEPVVGKGFTLARRALYVWSLTVQNVGVVFENESAGCVSYPRPSFESSAQYLFCTATGEGQCMEYFYGAELRMRRAVEKHLGRKCQGVHAEKDPNSSNIPAEPTVLLQGVMLGQLYGAEYNGPKKSNKQRRCWEQFQEEAKKLKAGGLLKKTREQKTQAKRQGMTIINDDVDDDGGGGDGGNGVHLAVTTATAAHGAKTTGQVAVYAPKPTRGRRGGGASAPGRRACSHLRHRFYRLLQTPSMPTSLAVNAAEKERLATAEKAVAASAAQVTALADQQKEFQNNMQKFLQSAGASFGAAVSSSQAAEPPAAAPASVGINADETKDKKKEEMSRTPLLFQRQQQLCKQGQGRSREAEEEKARSNKTFRRRSDWR
eukprot:6191342-Pleurochrysis_carterae.AAC.6